MIKAGFSCENVGTRNNCFHYRFAVYGCLYGTNFKGHTQSYCVGFVLAATRSRTAQTAALLGFSRKERGDVATATALILRNKNLPWQPCVLFIISNLSVTYYLA